MVVGLTLGFLLSISNGRNTSLSLIGGLIFSLIVGLIVMILSWATEVAEEKGYSVWGSILLIVTLNVVGVLILLLLPSKKHN